MAPLPANGIYLMAPGVENGRIESLSQQTMTRLGPVGPVPPITSAVTTHDVRSRGLRSAPNHQTLCHRTGLALATVPECERI